MITGVVICNTCCYGCNIMEAHERLWLIECGDVVLIRSARFWYDARLYASIELGVQPDRLTVSVLPERIMEALDAAA